jgi:hypothetical protein
VTKPDLGSLPHSVEDKRAIAELRTLQTVTVAELLKYENDAGQLSSYLSNFRNLNFYFNVLCLNI